MGFRRRGGWLRRRIRRMCRNHRWELVSYIFFRNQFKETYKTIRYLVPEDADELAVETTAALEELVATIAA